MSANAHQNAEATLNLPALTDHAAVLDALSQLLQAVALNQIDTKRANLLLRGLSLATRLAAALEKEKQESVEPASQETRSSINVMASAEEDEVNRQPETPQAQAIATIEQIMPLTLPEKIAARRAHISRMAMQFPIPSAGRLAPGRIDILSACK